MRRTIPAVAVAVMLLAPASALAECAWVRWQRQDVPAEDGYTTSWSVEGVKTTKKECDRTNPSTRSATTDGRRVVVSWLCLPDTIDPRGPKVK